MTAITPWDMVGTLPHGEEVTSLTRPCPPMIGLRVSRLLECDLLKGECRGGVRAFD